MAGKARRLSRAGRSSADGPHALRCAGAARTAAARSHHAPRAAAGSCGRSDDRRGRRCFGCAVEDDGSQDHRVPPIPTALPGYTKGYDIDPHAGAGNYDDSRWPTIEPKDLAARRGGGRVSFIWYRTNLTIPAKIGDFDTAGAVAVLHVLVDDYAEIWINGQIPRRAGRSSPATIQGFNMPNRVVLTETVNAGDTFQIAVFGINGPISLAPPNTVWFREAKMEFIR